MVGYCHDMFCPACWLLWSYAQEGETCNCGTKLIEAPPVSVMLEIDKVKSMGYSVPKGKGQVEQTRTTWRCRIFGHARMTVPNKPGYGFVRAWYCLRDGCDAHFDGFLYPLKPFIYLNPPAHTPVFLEATATRRFTAAARNSTNTPKSDGDDGFLAGVVIGSLISGSTPSEPSAPSPEPMQGGGGTFDGGGGSADFGTGGGDP